MNTYLEILLWTIAVYIFASAIVHFIKVIKSKDKSRANLMKAVVYVSGGLALITLLVYKPFGLDKITKILKPHAATSTAETIMITTTTMGGTTV
jgi:hypothetical protein